MLMFPFKATLEEINKDPENYIDSVFSCLESEFLVRQRIYLTHAKERHESYYNRR